MRLFGEGRTVLVDIQLEIAVSIGCEPLVPDLCGLGHVNQMTIELELHELGPILGCGCFDGPACIFTSHRTTFEPRAEFVPQFLTDLSE